MTKKSVESSDVAEEIRKLAHVDAMIALSQTSSEKRDGIMRLSLVAHRHKNFSETQQVMVLQQLGLGQTLLDSEIVREWEGTNQTNSKD